MSIKTKKWPPGNRKNIYKHARHYITVNSWSGVHFFLHRRPRVGINLLTRPPPPPSLACHFRLVSLVFVSHSTVVFNIPLPCAHLLAELVELLLLDDAGVAEPSSVRSDAAYRKEARRKDRRGTGRKEGDECREGGNMHTRCKSSATQEGSGNGWK